jgi:hypothetical protein
MSGSTSIDYKHELEMLVESATKYATAWACHHQEWNSAMKRAKYALNHTKTTATIRHD